jgi:penicillin-binding protein 2
MQVPQSEIRNPQSLPWYSGDTLGLAIGQSRLTVTPLQIARMMAAVANDGYLVMPHVVEVAAVGAGNLDAIEIGDRLASPLSGQFEPRRIPGLSPTTLSQVREGLKKVVANPRGTGYKRVRLKEIEIAGKTGTAEVGGGKPDHAWFAGYVPADEPRIAFVVVLENAGAGGSTAGPVAQQLVRLMLADGLLRPARVTLRE